MPCSAIVPFLTDCCNCKDEHAFGCRKQPPRMIAIRQAVLRGSVFFQPASESERVSTVTNRQVTTGAQALGRERRAGRIAHWFRDDPCGPRRWLPFSTWTSAPFRSSSRKGTLNIRVLWFGP